jgi:hydroxymethylglutaryl-CoA synthase
MDDGNDVNDDENKSSRQEDEKDNDENKGVGILAIEIYTPSTYILQSELEEHSGVAKGRYTIGLGQEGLGLICGDAEDVNSLALTVVHSLLEK